MELMVPKPDDMEKPATDADLQPDDLNEAQPPKPDPTRYGDWEKNGRCIDF